MITVLPADHAEFLWLANHQEKFEARFQRDGTQCVLHELFPVEMESYLALEAVEFTPEENLQYWKRKMLSNEGTFRRQDAALVAKQLIQSLGDQRIYAFYDELSILSETEKFHSFFSASLSDFIDLFDMQLCCPYLWWPIDRSWFFLHSIDYPLAVLGSSAEFASTFKSGFHLRTDLLSPNAGVSELCIGSYFPEK